MAPAKKLPQTQKEGIHQTRLVLSHSLSMKQNKLGESTYFTNTRFSVFKYIKRKKTFCKSMNYSTFKSSHLALFWKISCLEVCESILVNSPFLTGRFPFP